MNEEFINVYIEIMNKKIEDLIRSEILLQTRLTIAEKVVVSLTDDKKKLQEEIDRLNNLEKSSIKLVKKDKDF